MPKPAGQNTVLALQLEAAIKQARALRDAGKIAEAGALCQRILKTDPRHVEALHLMGALALQTDAFDIAIMTFNRALAEKPRSPAILFDLAQALNADGRPAEAISAYRKALTLRPNDVAAYLGLGDAQLDMGNATDALKSYRKAQSLDPQNRLAAHMVAGLTGQGDAVSASYAQALFDGYASTFEAHLTEKLGYDVPQRLQGAVHPFLPLGGQVASALDLGCGTGLVATAFKDVALAIDGIDIAPAMIDAAQDKQIYRTLRAGDLVDVLNADPAFTGPYDLVLAADVFIYVGALGAVFDAVRPRLAPGGLFAFSIEETEQATVTVRSSGRYAHSQDYILTLAQSHSLTVRATTALTIRTERSKPIPGQIIVLQAQ